MERRSQATALASLSLMGVVGGVVVVAVIVLKPGRVLRLLSWGLPVVLTARRGVAAWLQRPHRAALEP